MESHQQDHLNWLEFENEEAVRHAITHYLSTHHSSFTRTDIHRFLTSHHLKWEDESNEQDQSKSNAVIVAQAPAKKHHENFSSASWLLKFRFSFDDKLSHIDVKFNMHSLHSTIDNGF